LKITNDADANAQGEENVEGHAPMEEHDLDFACLLTVIIF